MWAMTDITCNCSIVAMHLEDGEDIPDEDLCEVHDIEMAEEIARHPYGV